MGLPQRTGIYVIVGITAAVAAIIAAHRGWMPHYTITAGPVSGDRTAGINGWYRVVRTNPVVFGESGNLISFYPGIVSPPSGGACIIFPAKDLGPGFSEMAAKTCETDENCGTNGVYGYCEPQTKKCWARPLGAEANKALCRKSGDPDGAIEVGNKMDVLKGGTIPITGFGLQPNAQARVLARLNCFTGEKCTKDKKTYLHVWGPPMNL